MMSCGVNIHTDLSPDAVADQCADFIAGRLRIALDQRGRASLALSGGSSPRLMYERLGDKPLAWDGVGVTLVDERWVARGEAGSNADFIQDCFANRPAKRSHFVPLFNGHDTPAAGLSPAEQAVAGIAQPLDVCVMGMGSDGHTASWFPNGPGLMDYLDADNPRALCAPDASGQSGSSGFSARISLTFSAIAKSRLVILLLPSQEKNDAFQLFEAKSEFEAPVNALRQLGDKLHIFTVSKPS